jgi:hypothetical protein
MCLLWFKYGGGLRIECSDCIRTVVLFQEGSFLFEVEGDGFFYKQVRNMVRDCTVLPFCTISWYITYGKSWNEKTLEDREKD